VFKNVEQLSGQKSWGY